MHVAFLSPDYKRRTNSLHPLLRYVTSASLTTLIICFRPPWTQDDIVVMIPASISDELFNSTDIALDMMLVQAIIGETGIRIGSLSCNPGCEEAKHSFLYSYIRVKLLVPSTSATDPDPRSKLVVELKIRTRNTSAATNLRSSCSSLTTTRTTFARSQTCRVECSRQVDQ